MASHWRIRHKLMLGLGLVVSIMVLLLGGTLIGLLSYSASMKSIESKVAEESKVEDLCRSVSQLGAAKKPMGSLTEECDALQNEVHAAKKSLAYYEDQLRDTLNRRRDPNFGVEELGLVEQARKGFDQLEAAIAEVKQPAEHEGTITLLEQKAVKNAIAKLAIISDQLRAQLYDDIKKFIKDAQRPYMTSLTIVVTTTVLGVGLMACLLGFFYRWIFYPVRDLQEGAGRVAQGDFDHRIEVHSGDEMEELAAAFNDMTGRLQAMYKDLQQQVNERSRQLVRSERLASVGFLAAGVAHEINNPLASIAFCSEALESRIAEIVRRERADSEVVFKYLRMIQSEAFRCKNITQRLLEFSRSGERRRELTDMAEVVRSVLEVVQHHQASKGKRIVFDPPRPVETWINAQEIKSVILNLVVNALESMDEEGTLTIELGSWDKQALLIFKDNGCGMTSEILENIFEPFYTRSRTGKGTGLGLSISHRIIVSHGGEIEASSAGVNQGSTFTVRLPLLPAESVKEENLGHAAA